MYNSIEKSKDLCSFNFKEIYQDQILIFLLNINSAILNAMGHLGDGAQMTNVMGASLNVWSTSLFQPASLLLLLYQ